MKNERDALESTRRGGTPRAYTPADPKMPTGI